VLEAKGVCVKVSISEYAEDCDTAAELENTAVSTPDTLAEADIVTLVDPDPLILVEEELEYEGIEDTLGSKVPDAEVVKYEAVCTAELVVVTKTLIVWLHVLNNVNVAVLVGLDENVIVARIVFVIFDEKDDVIEPVFVFDVDTDALIVEVDVGDLEFVVVFVPVLLLVDVFDLKLELVNDGDPLELLDTLLDNVPLAELVKTVDSVELPVNLLNTDGADLGVAVPVRVRVINDVRDPLNVSVLFGEDVVLLLFLEDAVSVIVWIRDELEHELPLEVFVCVVVLVWVVDELDVLLGRWVNVTEKLFLRMVFVINGVNVLLFVETAVLLNVGDDVWVFDNIGLFELDEVPVDVFDVVTDDVLVFVLTNVLDNLGVFEVVPDPVDVFEGAPDLVKDVDADDVFELFWEEVEHGEPDEVLEEDVDPVEVLELVDVLVGVEEDVIVDVRLEVTVLKGEDDDVFDIVADLVEVFVLTDVSDNTLVCV